MAWAEAGEENEMKGWYMAGLVTGGLFSTCFLCCICCKKDDLAVAIDVIDASADYMNGAKRILFVIFFHFFLGLLVVVVWMIAMLCVSSLNEIQPKHEFPFKDWDWDGNTKYMALYMLFGILWITAWIEYANCFVVMVGAASYYFDSTKEREGEASICKGFKYAYLHHAGSIACGAFIIALVRFIRIVFVYMAK